MGKNPTNIQVQERLKTKSLPTNEMKKVGGHEISSPRTKFWGIMKYFIMKLRSRGRSPIIFYSAELLLRYKVNT